MQRTAQPTKMLKTNRNMEGVEGIFKKLHRTKECLVLCTLEAAVGYG